ncbi:3'-5' exonuclease [Halalkalibacter urbisdiaboli]|uniref:3'-5' exonuclease n=1 Tax=Halalkalibacter urbisdiaboli TaxID=1960589 RepID=UPI0013FD17AA|nr:3'-5' exonuclease [Halalkalibacter urbisdiaboli]
MMIAVVFDLELMKRFKKGQLSEIVEIGACKIDLETKQIIDQIQIYISPKRGISKSTRKFIKMNDDDVKNALTFHTGIERFVQWLNDDYYLCAWGKDDKFHLLNQCLRNRMNVDWLRNYNDIQKPISNLLKAEHQLGLKNALQTVGIEATGKAHRGIDDAINTAKLFLHFQQDITLVTNTISAEERKKHKPKFKKKNRKQRPLSQEKTK